MSIMRLYRVYRARELAQLVLEMDEPTSDRFLTASIEQVSIDPAYGYRVELHEGSLEMVIRFNGTPDEIIASMKHILSRWPA